MQTKKRNPLKKTFLEHFLELRSRLLLIILFFLLTSLLGYLIRDKILSLFLILYDQPLFYTSPTAGLELAIKVSATFGACLTLPILLFEMFQFIKPALREELHKYPLFVVSVSFLLTITGLVFAYFVSLPAALKFLSSFQSNDIQYFVSVGSFISFVVQYLFVFVVIFQLPLVMIFINAITPLNPKKLVKYQSWVFIGSFVFSAILTPTPDPINQAMMAVPLFILYEITALYIYFLNNKSGKLA